MATLYIEEFAELPVVTQGQVMQAAMQPALATQAVSISGTSAQSSAFNASTRYVRLHTDAICSYLFGTNPTATTSHPRMGAGHTEYFAVPKGQSYKVAAITNT